MARILRFLVFIILAVSILGSVHASAAAESSPTGISLSPFLQQIRIEPLDTQKSFSLQITNRTENIQEIGLSARDFGSLNDTGGLLLEGSNGYAQKYGLASWMTLDRDSVVLNPHESVTVSATIDNRSSLQPGGHYGAVVATIGKLDDQSQDKIVINQQLLSLVLVTKIGGEHYDLKLNSIQHNGNWLHLPDTVKLRFQNPGNVHVVPRGLVKLVSPSGTVLAQGIINDESAYVLPESFREIPVQLQKVGSALPIPGNYHLAVQYRYEGFDRYATKKVAVHFLNIGMYIILFALVVLLYLLRLKWRWLRTLINRS